MDVERVERLRCDSARTANAVAVGHAIFLNQGDLDAVLRSVQSAAGSRIAGANNEHLGFDGFGDIGDGLGLPPTCASSRQRQRSDLLLELDEPPAGLQPNMPSAATPAAESVAPLSRLRREMPFFNSSIVPSNGISWNAAPEETASNATASRAGPRPRRRISWLCEDAPSLTLASAPSWMRCGHYRSEIGRDAPHIMGCLLFYLVGSLFNFTLSG